MLIDLNIILFFVAYSVIVLFVFLKTRKKELVLNDLCYTYSRYTFY